MIRNSLIQVFRVFRYPIHGLNKRYDHYSSSYSSLYVSAKYGQEIFRVVQPRYDADFLRYVGDNLEKLFQQRSIQHDYGDFDQIRRMLKDFLACMEQTEALKRKKNRLISKLKKKKNADDETLQEQYQTLSDDLDKCRENLYALEEKVIPILLNVPNQVAAGITAEQETLDQWKQSDDNFQNGSHSYVRLGYINNLYQRSIVGPNANYLLDQGALLYHGLIAMIADQLDQNGYIPINGLDLVKSAIVEAVNSRHSFATDPYMLKVGTGQHQENQRLHLVGEASLESLCAFIAKHPLERSKLYQVGSCYQTDSLNQQHLVRATVITDPRESPKMMKDLYQLWWNVLSQIGVQRCCLRTDIQSLYHNEYDKYVLLAWLKNRGEWIQVGQVSNHHHYIHQRLGFVHYDRQHLISSTMDLIPLIYCIVEQYQVFETGQVKIPPRISKI